jgi:hypothetical protein
MIILAPCTVGFSNGVALAKKATRSSINLIISKLAKVGRWEGGKVGKWREGRK